MSFDTPDVGVVFTPTGEDVLAYLGLDSSDEELNDLAWVHLLAVTNAARARTRGRGFDNGQCAEGIAAVIVSATARSMSNPTGERSSTIGGISTTPANLGWTIHERAALDAWRDKIA